MHPSSILSYYPNYELLDSALSRGEFNQLNLFVDLKNVLQTIYLKHAVETIVENSLRTNYNDTSVFSSVLPFLAFHKLYAIKRGINVNFYFFFEVGQSFYHKNLNKKYKISRKIDDLYGLSRDKREKFTEVLQSNFQLINKALNFLPNVKVFMLEHLEADFIPYYLISRDHVGTNENECNLIYSNDHDLQQTCNDNTYVFAKSGKKKSFLTKDDIMTKFLKTDVDIPVEYLPYAMSIMGDSGDDIEGIKGIGQKTLYKNFDEIRSLINDDINGLYDNVMNGNDIFVNRGIVNENKYINKIIEAEDNNSLITRNLKQISFELISRHLDSPNTTDMVKKKNRIIEILNNNKKAHIESFRKSLDMNRIFVEGDELEVIYYDFLNEGKTNSI